MYQNVQLEQNIQEINNFVPICFQLEHCSIGCLVLYNVHHQARMFGTIHHPPTPLLTEKFRPFASLEII